MFESKNVDRALATFITAAEDTVNRGVALVSCAAEAILVCLHNIKFRTPVATNLVGVTVLERVGNVVRSGH